MKHWKYIQHHGMRPPNNTVPKNNVIGQIAGVLSAILLITAMAAAVVVTVEVMELLFVRYQAGR